MDNAIRELPPPTSREAYLPQRPGRTQKREASEMRLTHPLAGRKARETKQKPQSNQVNSAPGWSREEPTRRPALRWKQKGGGNP